MKLLLVILAIGLGLAVASAQMAYRDHWSAS